MLMRVQPLTFNEIQTLQSASQYSQSSRNTRSALCNAMRVGDQAGPNSQDEKQGLLNNINRIKMHGSYPDAVGRDAVHNTVAGVHGAFQGARASATDTFGWLRRALQDPDDFKSAAVGKMVSKEYGRHERSHTEHHLWRSASSPYSSPATSPPSSPLASIQQQQHQQVTSSSPAAPAAIPMGSKVPAAAKTSPMQALGQVEQHAGRSAGATKALGGPSVTPGDAAGAAKDQMAS